MGSLVSRQKSMPIIVANLNVFGDFARLLGIYIMQPPDSPANRASRATRVAGVPSYGFTCFMAKINANHSG